MMFNFCLLVLSLVAVGVLNMQHDSVETEWMLWKWKYNKSYEGGEEEVRKSVWLDHYEVYRRHSQKAGRQYEMEMNEFADQILPRKVLGHLGENPGDDGESTGLRFAPSEWDWRQHGVVTPVKNQGMTGVVVPIVATECVESYHAIKTGALVDLSVVETQQCCVPMPFLSEGVFKCIHNIGGLCSADSYPKTAQTCRNDSCTPVATVKDGKMSPKGDEEALKEAVYTVPVMAGIDASHPSFQLYRSGVYSEPGCSEVQIDHAIQIVGYGSVNGQDYWICRNSWGASWGMNGYIFIARNKGNMCGIASMASYPV